MSSGSEIGQLCQTRSKSESKHQIEWTIGGIFSYATENAYYISPSFAIEGSQWFFRIYPSGQTPHNCAGWISLYLYRSGDKTSPKCVHYEFGVRKANDAVEQMGKDLSWVFGAEGTGFGRHKYLEISELLRRKTELTPSDTLTLVCSLSVIDDILNSTCTLDTLSENLANLFVSKEGCDTTLRVHDEEFSVHRCILAARSAVFKAMFAVDMKEKNTSVVDIVDCDVGAFKDFLLFLYSGRFRIDSDKVPELYKIADKYCVVELRSACVLYMMSHLTVETFCETAILGYQFDDESLQEKTKVFFNENFGKIIHATSWKSFLKGNNDLVNELLMRMALVKNL